MKAPIYSYDGLRQVAAAFLAERHPNRTLPVPVEPIVERMGIDIVCQMSLQHICGVDAFVNQQCDAIYIDGEVYLSPNLNRLRFSLAHELAHVILHREQVTSMRFNTMGEWKEAWKKIPDEEYAWLEWQAYSLAGLILVPSDALSPLYRETQERVSTKWAGRTPEFITSVVISELASAFSVSTEVIERRCEKDQLPH